MVFICGGRVFKSYPEKVILKHADIFDDLDFFEKKKKPDFGENCPESGQEYAITARTLGAKLKLHDFWLNIKKDPVRVFWLGRRKAALSGGR